MNLIHAHPYIFAFAAYFVFSNAVLTMPSPDPAKSSVGYKWAFGLLHALGAGIPRALVTLAPDWPITKWIVSLSAPGGDTKTN